MNKKIILLASAIILLQGCCTLQNANRNSAKAGCKIGYFSDEGVSRKIFLPQEDRQGVFSLNTK